MALQSLSKRGNYLITKLTTRASSSAKTAAAAQNGAKLPEFAGIKATVFTNEIKFVSDQCYDPIPIYRICDNSGEVINKDEEPKLETEKLMHMYKTMVLLNQYDKILYESQRQGRISFFMTNFGEEGVQIGSASALAPEDLLYLQYREAGVILYRGLTVRQMIDQCYGNKDDSGKGKMMPVHYGSKNINVFTISSPLGTQLPQAVGTSYALKRMPNNDRCTVCYFGEGAASEGDAHAAFNFAATLDCPVLFICRNNGYAISTPAQEQYRGDGIAGRAAAYGIHVLRVDGTDTLAVHNVVKRAREFAVTHNKPVLVEAMAYRVGHHSTSDDSTAYRSLEEIQSWNKEANPIEKFKSYLIEKGLWSEEQNAIETKQARALVMKHMLEAEKVKKPNWREMFDDVYYIMPPNLQKQRREMEEHIKKYKEHYPLSSFEGNS